MKESIFFDRRIFQDDNWLIGEGMETAFPSWLARPRSFFDNVRQESDRGLSVDEYDDLVDEQECRVEKLLLSVFKQ